jgi:hypothetical protein
VTDSGMRSDADDEAIKKDADGEQGGRREQRQRDAVMPARYDSSVAVSSHIWTISTRMICTSRAPGKFPHPRKIPQVRFRAHARRGRSRLKSPTSIGTPVALVEAETD